MTDARPTPPVRGSDEYLVHRLYAELAALRTENAALSATIETCHRSIDSLYGLGNDGTTAMDTLPDRLAALRQRLEAAELERDGLTERVAQIERSYSVKIEDTNNAYAEVKRERDRLRKACEEIASGQVAGQYTAHAALAPEARDGSV